MTTGAKRNRNAVEMGEAKWGDWLSFGYFTQIPSTLLNAVLFFAEV